MDVAKEILFKTMRSGGKGGQNVNKVETAVMALFHVDQSTLLTESQKKIVQEKLSPRINAEGYLMVKSQIHRTQLANKNETIKKINQLLTGAVQKKKARIATKATKASIEKRIESKRKISFIKKSRKKYRED